MLHRLNNDLSFTYYRQQNFYRNIREAPRSADYKGHKNSTVFLDTISIPSPHHSAKSNIKYCKNDERELKWKKEDPNIGGRDTTVCTQCASMMPIPNEFEQTNKTGDKPNADKNWLDASYSQSNTTEGERFTYNGHYMPLRQHYTLKFEINSTPGQS